MSVFIGQFSPDRPPIGSSSSRTSAADTAVVATFVDVQRNLLRAKPGDVLSFYHLNTMMKQGSVVVAGTPTLSHNTDAIAEMRCAGIVPPCHLLNLDLLQLADQSSGPLLYAVIVGTFIFSWNCNLTPFATCGVPTPQWWLHEDASSTVLGTLRRPHEVRFR
jgi:hypothetical protein